MILFNSNVRLARDSIRSNRWRSFLTMLGIIIGVMAVITTVSLGEGVKQQISSQITKLGDDLIIIRPGQFGESAASDVSATSPIFTPVTRLLTDRDVQAVMGTEGVADATPLSIISGLPSYQERELPRALVVGTTATYPEATNQPVEFGQFFNENDAGRNFAAIGKNVAAELFGENVPVGKSFELRGERFVVKGVMGDFQQQQFMGTDLNNAIFIPYITGQTLNEGTTQVFQLFARPTEDVDPATIQKLIEEKLLETRGGQEDFTVMQQDETLASTNNTLSLVMAMVSGVAAISLVVGGIGIMNVMLVSVTERTREIGVRKAVGATTRQITSQFLIEAVLLSFMGGIIGVLLSLVVNFIIRVSTDLTPVISLPVIAIAVLVSISVGVIFGVAPAVRAAHKDPIEALRHE